MKKAIITTISILAMVNMVSINTVSAGERHIVFEMAESGVMIVFPARVKEENPGHIAKTESP